MKLSSQVYLREIDGKVLIVADSDLGLDYTKVVRLNDTASFLLANQNRNEEFTKEDWVALLVKCYDVDAEMASKDVDTLIEDLSQMGIIEE